MCAPNRTAGCEVGDLTGKHAPVNVAGMNMCPVWLFLILEIFHAKIYDLQIVKKSENFLP